MRIRNSSFHNILICKEDVKGAYSLAGSCLWPEQVAQTAEFLARTTERFPGQVDLAKVQVRAISEPCSRGVFLVFHFWKSNLQKRVSAPFHYDQQNYDMHILLVIIIMASYTFMVVTLIFFQSFTWFLSFWFIQYTRLSYTEQGLSKALCCKYP